MNKKTKKIINGIGIGLVLAVFSVANIFAYLFRDVITIALCGFGINNDGLDHTQAELVCENIEAEGIVLLKNDNNALPLESDIPVNVFGWSSIAPAYSGGGSGSTGTTNGVVSILDGLRDAGLEPNQHLVDFYKGYQSGRSESGYWASANPYLDLIEPEMDKYSGSVSMTSLRDEADNAIVVITRLGGEHQDLPKFQVKSKGQPTDDTRTYLDLTTEEENLLLAIKEQNYDTVTVIVNSINTMNVGFVDNELFGVDAAINVGAIGQKGGKAIGKVLTGEVNPSGRTADTYVYDFRTNPTFVTSPNGHKILSNPTDTGELTGGVRKYTNTNEKDECYYLDYNESIYVGYKWYETADKDGFWSSDLANETWGVSSYEEVVQYPFGFGLSYSSFDWTVTSVSPSVGSKITADTEFEITLAVTNTGEKAGADVIELYSEPPYKAGGIEKAAKNLVAFAKTAVIEAGGSQDNIKLNFKATDLASYDCYDMDNNGFTGYELEDGTYNLYLSTDAHNVKEGIKGVVANPVINYHVDSTINLSEIDGYEVVNRFTGDDALCGIPADGGESSTTASQDIAYLTRDDFESTFPFGTEMNRSRDFTVNYNYFTGNNTNEKFTTGASNGLKLYDDEGNPKMELINILGQDYDAEEWDELLDQMSIDDLKDLTQLGGYRTSEISSISKPKLIDLDGPQGFNTEVMAVADQDKPVFVFFPNETVIAQTWSVRMAYTFGLCMGVEGSKGVSGWYAPGANIHRTPFGGRNFEYYSEDGLLSGKMAAYAVKGARNTGVYAYVKHFAVNETANIGDGASTGLNTWLTEQAMREIYLKGFEIAVKEGKATGMMAAYSRIGAIWCGASAELLTGILREEWGFKGTVITDAYTGNTVYELIPGFRSGLDLVLNSANNELLINESTCDWKTDTGKAMLRRAAKNILWTLTNTISSQDAYNKAIANGENPDEAIYMVEVTGKGANDVAKWWVYALIGVDILAIAGCSFWTYKIFFSKKKTNSEKN